MLHILLPAVLFSKYYKNGNVCIFYCVNIPLKQSKVSNIQNTNHLDTIDVEIFFYKKMNIILQRNFKK